MAKKAFFWYDDVGNVIAFSPKALDEYENKYPFVKIPQKQYEEYLANQLKPKDFIVIQSGKTPKLSLKTSQISVSGTEHQFLLSVPGVIIGSGSDLHIGIYDDFETQQVIVLTKKKPGRLIVMVTKKKDPSVLYNIYMVDGNELTINHYTWNSIDIYINKEFKSYEYEI